jgi:dihydrofolate reductase
MRKLILSIMVSADGFTARSDGDIGWFLTDAAFEEEMQGLLESVDAMLFGRKSYLELAAFWPTAGTPGADDAPGGFTSRERAVQFARLMNQIPKVVFSTTLKELTWGPAELVRGDVQATVSRMKAAPGRDLVLFAGAGLAGSFMELDLIDEYRLMIHPRLLGRGIGLFAGLTAERPLTLLGAKTFSSGVALLRYARARGAA